MFQTFLGVHWSALRRAVRQAQLRFKVFAQLPRILTKKGNSYYSDMLVHLFTTEKDFMSGYNVWLSRHDLRNNSKKTPHSPCMNKCLYCI